MSIRDCNVYLWLDNNTPFYVGIGGDKRLSQVKRNKWATNRRKQAESQGSFRQEVVLQGSRSACCETEKLLISAYGSVVNGGLLFNFTAGGDGGVDAALLTEDAYARVVEGGKNGGKTTKKNKVGIFSPEFHSTLVQNGVVSGALAVSTGQLERARELIDYEAMRPQMVLRGRDMGQSNKGKTHITNGVDGKTVSSIDDIPEGWWVGRSDSYRETLQKSQSQKVWEDPDHPELGRHNAGNLVRRQKANGLPHTRENRRKVNGH
jgi:hypothetical protein